MPSASQSGPAVVTGALKLLKWSLPPLDTFELIQEVPNDGAEWIEIDMSRSDYTAFDKDGNVAQTGSMSGAAPRFVAPHSVGYLVAQRLAQDAPLDHIVRVVVHGRFMAAAAPPASFTTSRVRLGPGFGNSVGVTGLVKNVSGSDATIVSVVVLLFDAGHKPLAYLSTLVGNLAADKEKGFVEKGDFPVGHAQVKSFEVYADSSF